MTGDKITAAYPASRAQVHPELAVVCSSLAANLSSTTSTYSAGLSPDPVSTAKFSHGHGHPERPDRYITFRDCWPGSGPSPAAPRSAGEVRLVAAPRCDPGAGLAGWAAARPGRETMGGWR